MARTEFQKQLEALKPDKRKRKVLLPARHPVRIEQQYAKMLRGIIDGINAELKTRIADELKAEIAAREDGYRADDLSAVLRAIRSLATGNIPGLSFVRNIGDSIRSAIDGNWQKAINQAIGVNVALPGTDMSANIDAWAEENTALITNLTQSYLSKITTAVNSGFRDGLSWREISKNIRAETGVAKRRADLIARDQVATMNMQVTKQRAADLEIKQFVWRTMEDQRVRGNPSGLYPKAKPSHYARNGKTYNWSDGAGARDKFPGQAINCFIGSTNFDFSNGCRKLWRRWYDGSIFSIETSSGATLHATPNHPILTRNGWTPVNAIKEGDYVINSVSYGSLVGKDDVNQLVARIDDVFNFMHSAGVLSTARGSKFDFHHDGSEMDVDVIDTTCFMPGDVKSIIGNGIRKLNLSRSLHGREDSVFSSLCSPDGSVDSVLPSSDGVMSLLGESASFLWGERGHSDQVCLSSRSAWDLVVRKYSGNDPSCNAIMLGEEKLTSSCGVHFANLQLWKIGDFVVSRAFFMDDDIVTPGADMLAECLMMAPNSDACFFESDARLYEFDRVVDNSIGYFSGHVYNLETETGWYNANAIVSHNCRCYASNVIEF